MIALFDEPAFYLSFAVIQAALLLLLIWGLDLYERQPLWLILLMAFWGATGAPLIALAGNRSVRGLLSGETQTVFGNAISAPLVEEGAKGIALIVAIGPLRWLARRFGLTVFEGLTAGIVYGAAVGIGFAFTEDFFYLLQRAQAQGVEAGLNLFLYRRDFFGPAVLHHSLFTAAFGAGLGLAAWSTRRATKILYPVIGLGIAITMHAANNGAVELVLTLSYGIDAAYAWTTGAIVTPAVRAPARTSPTCCGSSTTTTSPPSWLRRRSGFAISAESSKPSSPTRWGPASSTRATSRRSRAPDVVPPARGGSSGAASSSSGATSGSCNVHSFGSRSRSGA